MNIRGDSIRVMHPLFQEGEGGSTPTSPLQMRVECIGFDRAKELNRLWHSRLPRIGTGCIDNQPYLCFVADYQGILYAVAIWSNPVARELPQDTWLELRRLAIAPDAPRFTASWMLRIMRLLIRRKRPTIEMLVSSHDMDVHTGTIYKAAGWKKTIITRGHEWNSKARSRPKAQSAADKQRWEVAT